MNAPAQTGQTGTAPWKRYLPMVDAFCAGASPSERKMRCRMMFIRDQATLARQKTDHWAADQILATVEQIGLANASAAMPLEDLKMLGESMSELFTIAAKVSVAGGVA